MKHLFADGKFSPYFFPLLGHFLPSPFFLCFLPFETRSKSTFFGAIIDGNENINGRIISLNGHFFATYHDMSKEPTPHNSRRVLRQHSSLIITMIIIIVVVVAVNSVWLWLFVEGLLQLMLLQMLRISKVFAFWRGTFERRRRWRRG